MYNKNLEINYYSIIVIKGEYKELTVELIVKMLECIYRVFCYNYSNYPMRLNLSTHS